MRVDERRQLESRWRCEPGRSHICAPPWWVSPPPPAAVTWSGNARCCISVGGEKLDWQLDINAGIGWIFWMVFRINPMMITIIPGANKFDHKIMSLIRFISQRRHLHLHLVAKNRYQHINLNVRQTSQNVGASNLVARDSMKDSPVMMEVVTTRYSTLFSSYSIAKPNEDPNTCQKISPVVRGTWVQQLLPWCNHQ